MGVQSLTRFAQEQKQPQIYNQINILDEIRKWKSSNQEKNATIIFDVMGFVHVFGSSKIELNLGGRQHHYIHLFERFVKRLIEAGASLAFFCDGQLQSDKNDEWCRRRNTEYQYSMDAINSNNKNVNAHAFLKKRFGCKTIVKSLLKLIDDLGLGKIVISTRVDCDLAIAEYAQECSALAVVASDSDFLIFDGDFQWWHTYSLDLDRMLVNRFECSKFLKVLDLTHEQMKYLATIAGNDHTRHLITKSPNFNKIAEFCRLLCPPREQIYDDIVEFMQIDKRMGRQMAIDVVTKSIKSYDLDVCGIAAKATQMDTYCAANVLMFAFWNQQVFQYELNFVDFAVRHQFNQNNNNHDPFVQKLLLVFRKLAGIMLKNTDHRHATLKIVTKYSIDDDYTLKLHTPIYPQGYIDLDAILFGHSDDFDDTKWKLLLWTIGLNPQLRFDLQKIPRKFVPTILALMFLLQAGEITLLMADTILVTQYDIQETVSKVYAISTQVPNIRTESIRIGHLFNRIITLLWDCFMVCGLKAFIELDWYDGPYFNHLLQQFEKSDKSYKDAIQPINNYRIYTKVILDN